MEKKIKKQKVIATLEFNVEGMTISEAEVYVANLLLEKKVLKRRSSRSSQGRVTTATIVSELRK